MEIQPVSPVPVVTQKVESVQKVYKQPDGKDKIINDVYEIVTYDQKGRIKESISSHTVTYTV